MNYRWPAFVCDLTWTFKTNLDLHLSKLIKSNSELNVQSLRLLLDFKARVDKKRTMGAILR